MSNIGILRWEGWINPESCTPEREISLAILKEKQWHWNTLYTLFYVYILQKCRFYTLQNCPLHTSICHYALQTVAYTIQTVDYTLLQIVNYSLQSVDYTLQTVDYTV